MADHVDVVREVSVQRSVEQSAFPVHPFDRDSSLTSQPRCWPSENIIQIHLFKVFLTFPGRFGSPYNIDAWRFSFSSAVISRGSLDNER